MTVGWPHRRHSKWLSGFAAAMAMLAMGSNSLPSSACGYDNPDDLAQYYINIDYPKALYLRTAMLKAEAAGLIPAGSSGKLKRDIWALMRTTALLRDLGGRLSNERGAAETLPISLVLLEPALWTRYRVAGNGYVSDVHANGATAGDAVVVTDAPIVAALLAGKLTYAQADKLELLRFYGPKEAQHFARRLLSTSFPIGHFAEATR